MYISGTKKHIGNIIKDIEEMEDKKKSLQDKFLKAVKENAKNSKNNNIDSSKSIQSYKTKKDCVSDSNLALQEKIQTLKTKNKHISLELSNSKKEIIKLKDKNYNLITDMSNINNQNLELSKKFEKINLENNSLKSDLTFIEIELKKYKESDLHQKYSEVKEMNKKLYRQIDILKSTIKNKNTEIEKYKFKLEIGETAEKKIFNQSQTLNELQVTHKKLKTEFDLIKEENEYIKKTFVYKYFLYKLKITKKYKYMVEKISSIKSSKLNKVQEEAVETSKNLDIQWGYLFLEDKKVKFCNMSGEIFLLNPYKTYYRRLVNRPIQAVIEDNYAKIFSVHRYSNLQSYTEKIFKKKDEEKLSTFKSDSLSNEFVGKKVLIVGSRFKDKYKSELSKIGCEVVWFDPYEENITLLNNIINKMDVVIVCISHVSHSSTEILKKYSGIKIQPITNDNIKSIIARIRYVLINSDVKSLLE